jgi:geranylgeranyl transferase type-2 subunit beta
LIDVTFPLTIQCALVKNLQNPDGSFRGDDWGEIDSRFSYCSINCMRLLGRLHELNLEAAIDWVNKCKNFDGAYGCIPDAESHAGQSWLI